MLIVACRACTGTGVAERRCRKCFGWHAYSDYLAGGKTRLLRVCAGCRRRDRPRGPINVACELRVRFVRSSRNAKTGQIPVTMTSPNTCPPACPWMGTGCYADQSFSRIHWRRLAAGAGLTWDDFCGEVARLPQRQLWRHNEAGDLPGEGDAIDERLLRQLLEASRHTRGFTYTHKPVLGDGTEAAENRRVLTRLRDYPGLTINLSADGLLEADAKAALGLGPVTVVVPDDGRTRGLRTPAGRRVVVCPAVTTSHSRVKAERITCETCGLCERRDRPSIVAFPAHGGNRHSMGERLVQLRLFAT